MKPDGLNNIVVVGAGSAGWMTALYMNRLYPESNITVIGSRELGILGAGEGTVPNFKNFLNDVQISGYDLFKYCKSTLKLAIKFVNWRGDGKYYYHSFSRKNNQQFLSDNGKTSLKLARSIITDINFIDLNCYVNGDEMYDYDYIDQHIENAKIPFTERNLVEKFPNTDETYSWHFDAVDLAKFFESVAIKRGINYIDDYITSFDQDQEGYIVKINMKGGFVDCDFVLDCSGFKRLIIGKLYNAEWVSLQDSLTVNRAIPFFLPPEEKLKNYTTATAMNNGWVWEIPLQHRTGSGYVFNSNFCDDETAKQELRNKYGNLLEIDRVFSFDAGYYKTPWIKNCIALGLSSGFVEPLEATSIWLTTIMLNNIKEYVVSLPRASQKLIDQYNNIIESSNANIASFIQFHYLSDRRDTEFWRDINSRSILPKNKSLIDIWKIRMPEIIDKNYLANFALVSWSRVGFGIGFFSEESVKHQLDFYKNHYKDFNSLKQFHKTSLQQQVNESMTHQKFLEMIVGSEQLERHRKLIFQ